MIKAIHHIAIIAGNYQLSKHFYTEVLGFRVLKETYRAERDSYKLDLAIGENYQIELFSFPMTEERKSFPEAKGLRHLAFAVEDIQAAHQYLIHKNVVVEPIRTDNITGKKFFFFQDPDGQPLEMYEQ